MLKLLLILIISIFDSSPVTHSSSISLLICDASTGEVIASENASMLASPASTMKVITTATALEAYGTDYRIPTFLEYTGTIADGVLDGDLYIRGNGDPSLGSEKVGDRGFLNKWVRAVSAAGIKHIRGGVVADLSYFDADATNPGWLWEDLGNYYAPGIFPLSYLDNTMNVVLRSGPIGSVASVSHTVPEVPGIKFDNHIRCTATTRDGAYVHGGPYNYTRYLTGSVPSNEGSFGVKGDLPNPGLLLAQHFTRHLESAGIAVDHEASFISETDGTHRDSLFTWYSPTLSELVKETNIHSNNLYAESLFRILGGNYSTPCTIDNSKNFMIDFWLRRGVPMRAACIIDGCGLAPQDGVSAEIFVNLLNYMRHSANFPAFYSSLPVSGQSGTLRGFLAKTELEGRVHAKSGYIKGTRCYVGYIELPDNRTWTFAVLVNRANGKARDISNVIERYLLDVYRSNR